MTVWTTSQAVHERRPSSLLAAETVGFAHGTTLIIITPSTDLQWAKIARHLDRAGLQVVAILIDPEPFGGHSGIADVSAQLIQGGIPSYVIRRDSVIQDVLTKPVYLRRPV